MNKYTGHKQREHTDKRENIKHAYWTPQSPQGCSQNTE